MKITQVNIDRFLVALERTPRILEELSAGHDAEDFHIRMDQSTWSPNDVLAHLCSCADIWGKSITAMLADVNPALPDIHPRQWIRQTDYRKLDFRASLAAFSLPRRRWMKLLRGLDFEQWSRGAGISGRRHTVFSHVRRMTKHEIGHIVQIRNSPF